MAMPADGIAAIKAFNPLRFWVMNEPASGFTGFADQMGNAPLTKGAGVTPAAQIMSGERNIGGPQTPAPTFDGSATATASCAGPVLGGLPLGWSIVMWFESPVVYGQSPSLENKTLYCERGSSGNDILRFYIHNSVLALTVGDDTVANARTAQTGPSNSNIYRPGIGRFCGVSVDATGHVRFYVDGPFGMGLAYYQIQASHTWTNAGQRACVGFDPLDPTASMNGSICWVALFDSSFTPDQFYNMYKATAPQVTPTWTKAAAGGKPVFPNSAFWNEPLADNAPIAPNSAGVVAQWWAWTTSRHQTPYMSAGVPMFNVDRVGVNATRGDRSLFAPFGDQFNFLRSAPTPVGLLTEDPYPANLGSDGLSWWAQPSVGFHAEQYQGFTPPVLFPPIISAAAGLTDTGSLTAGAYDYVVTAVNSNGESFGPGNGYSPPGRVALGATGRARLTMAVDAHGNPPPTSWRVYRHGPYSTSSPASIDALDYGLLTTVTNLVDGLGNIFYDDGSYGTPNNTQHPPQFPNGTATTTDPCSTGGGGSWDYNKNFAFNVNFKGGWAVNGSSATSCPNGGALTVEEALTGLIEHPIPVAFPFTNTLSIGSAMKWPAKRHDGRASGALCNVEGMRWRLPAGFDENSLTYNDEAHSGTAAVARFQKAIVVALRDYGLIIRDMTPGSMGFYLEDPSASGRNDWNHLMGGLTGGGSDGNLSVLAVVPWSQCQVLMPQRYPSKVDSSGRRTNRLDATGYPTPVPY